MPNLDTLVDELSGKLPTPKLKELADRFGYKDPDLPERLGQIYQANGFLTLDQASELVDWKTGGRQKSNFCHENTDTSVRLVTGFAAEAANKLQDSPEIAAAVLLALKAVHFPTASAILTGWNPNDYGIVDIRAWSALKALTGSKTFDRGKRTLFTIDEFRLYTLLLRRWRDQTGISPRTIDKALWQFDNERGKDD